jgi:dihydroxyacid dehydratase/phosphogluconate dehydratase
MLSTTANPTDGRFDGDANSIAEGNVHPEVYRGAGR